MTVIGPRRRGVRRTPPLPRRLRRESQGGPQNLVLQQIYSKSPTSLQNFPPPCRYSRLQMYPPAALPEVRSSRRDAEAKGFCIQEEENAMKTGIPSKTAARAIAIALGVACAGTTLAFPAHGADPMPRMQGWLIKSFAEITLPAPMES